MRIPLLSLSWRGVSYGGTEGTEVGAQMQGGFRMEGLGWHGGRVFSRRHGGHGGGGLGCRGAFARRAWWYGGGVFSRRLLPQTGALAGRSKKFGLPMVGVVCLCWAFGSSSAIPLPRLML